MSDLIDDLLGRTPEHHHGHGGGLEEELHTIPVPVPLLGQILTDLTYIKRTLTRMEEKLDTANAELDELELAEEDLATQAHAAVDLITTESANIVDLMAQVKALTDAAASGSAIMPSTVNALNTRILASLGKVQAQTATLKAALPPPPAPPVVEPPPAQEPQPTTTAGDSIPPPADNPPADPPVAGTPSSS